MKVRVPPPSVPPGPIDRGNRRQHDSSSPQEAERGRFLQNEGYRILRFWNNEVLANLDGVHQAIADELGRITPNSN